MTRESVLSTAGDACDEPLFAQNTANASRPAPHDAAFLTILMADLQFHALDARSHVLVSGRANQGRFARSFHGRIHSVPKQVHAASRAFLEIQEFRRAGLKRLDAQFAA
jgi:hypothetical protein